MLEKIIHQNFLKKNVQTKFDKENIGTKDRRHTQLHGMKLDTAVSVQEPLSSTKTCSAALWRVRPRNKGGPQQAAPNMRG